MSNSKGPMTLTAGVKRARRCSGDRLVRKIKLAAHRRVRRSVRQKLCVSHDDQDLMMRGACERVVC